MRSPIQHALLAGRPRRELERSGSLRAEPPAAYRRVWVAFDVGDFAILDVQELTATHRAVWAYGPHNAIRRAYPRPQPLGRRTPDGGSATRTVAAHRLPHNWPTAPGRETGSSQAELAQLLVEERHYLGPDLAGLGFVSRPECVVRCHEGMARARADRERHVLAKAQQFLLEGTGGVRAEEVVFLGH